MQYENISIKIKIIKYKNVSTIKKSRGPNKSKNSLINSVPSKSAHSLGKSILYILSLLKGKLYAKLKQKEGNKQNMFSKIFPTLCVFSIPLKTIITEEPKAPIKK